MDRDGPKGFSRADQCPSTARCSPQCNSSQTRGLPRPRRQTDSNATNTVPVSPDPFRQIRACLCLLSPLKICLRLCVPFASACRGDTRAFNAAANVRSVVAPAFCASRMMGRTLARTCQRGRHCLHALLRATWSLGCQGRPLGPWPPQGPAGSAWRSVHVLLARAAKRAARMGQRPVQAQRTRNGTLWAIGR